MQLLDFNNKKIRLTDTDGIIWEGMASYCEADTFEEEQDALSIKQKIGGVMIFADEIESIEVID